MTDTSIFPVPQEWAKNAIITKERYEDMYTSSVQHTGAFWAKQAEGFWWHKRWDQVKATNFDLKKSPINIAWFVGAQTNICANALDRHLPARAHQTAIIWEGDNPAEARHVTYAELHKEVCRFANVLKAQGVKKGDVVTIYLPMIPEAAVAMLACARIGAIHSVIFGGFSADSIRGRIEDSKSTLVITADESVRGGKITPLKANVDEAIAPLDYVKRVIVVKRTSTPVAWSKRDVWYHEEMATVSEECAPEVMDAEDPLFILYTSGSTGKPKGVLHTTAGYMVWTSFTHRTVFDYKDGDVFWCTADIGWITGHSYGVYGPLLNGATWLMFEGTPNYPDNSRFWQVIDKHQVTIFHTAPTAIRALMREGDAPVLATSRKSLRLIGSVGEPINPEAWLWYHRVVGQGRCPIVDTWWQTETGGNMITPFPGATPLKPGAASWPMFGVQPVILDPTNGHELEGACEGVLAIKDSWPGQARTVFGDHARFEQTYFSQYNGYYFTGDGAKRDGDGYYWITGRVDDVLNISGHRIGTAEVESALVGHDRVTEAAVVGYPHDVKGQGMYCYVTLATGIEPSDAIAKDLKQWVRKEIGPFATPDIIHFTSALPKTRSGKIMRRILRKIAEGDTSNLGDTSTLLNPEIVDELVRGRQ